MNKNLEILQSAFDRLQTNENSIYFLVYDTKNNARAAVKHIYDMAFTLRNNGVNAKILSEDKTYNGVSLWLGDKYNDIPVFSIKEDKVELGIDDILVVPEYYGNILDQLANVKCVKVMLIQQVEYMYETLPIGSRWIDYGFDKIITTSEVAKKSILEYFPQSIVYVIPPIIGDKFVQSSKPLKPYIAISCRDRILHRKLISQFYLKYPQLRWVTFKDMVQMSYDEFAESLQECMVSLWIDDDSTFGTFPLESMKCGVPVVGKIPNLEPDWLGENGMWTYDSNKLLDILGTYILAWLEGVELKMEVKDKMKETLLPYMTSITENNIISIFNSFKDRRLESLKMAIEKMNKEEEKV